MTQAKSRLLGIDLIRVFAAFAVMAFHLAFWSWAMHGSTANSIIGPDVAFPELIWLTWWGRMGVYTFFVISGLVIAYSASLSTASEFLRSRFLRIWPTMLVCATVTLVVAVLLNWKMDELPYRYFYTLIFKPSGPWIDGVYWTLTVEIVFYAVISLVLFANRPPLFEIVISALGLISACIWIWRAASLSGMVPRPPFHEWPLLTYSCFFAAGALLWMMRMDKADFRRTAFLTICLIGGIVCTFLRERPLANVLGQPVLLVPVIWFLSVVAIALAVWRPLDLSPGFASVVKFAGLSTYPLYLLHDLCGAALIRILVSVGFNRFAALVSTIAAMISLAILVTAFVEPMARSAVASLFDACISIFGKRVRSVPSN